MTPVPYIFFHGQCREALDFYAEVFGGRIETVMPMSDLPPEAHPPGGLPEDKRDWVMHGLLDLGSGKLMASDDLSGETPPMAGCSISMSFPTAAEARAAFERLAEGGTVRMPLSATFWSAAFGMLSDRYGIRWMINTDEPPPEG
jgi:PhnB protein